MKKILTKVWTKKFTYQKIYILSSLIFYVRVGFGKTWFLARQGCIGRVWEDMVLSKIECFYEERTWKIGKNWWCLELGKLEKLLVFKTWEIGKNCWFWLGKTINIKLKLESQN